MGGVIARKHVHDAFMQGPDGIELFHGYTYSGHPLAAAAGEATLALYHEERLFDNAAALAAHFEEAAHSLRGLPHVIDIRNIGLMAAIELAPRADKPGARGYEALVRCFEAGLLTRTTGDTLACSPPLIVSKAQIDEIFATIGKVLRTIE
jgi:beta-alanine--pyruvate transaminase